MACVYLAEIAPAGRRGFYVSWQSASQQVAVVTAALVGVLLTATLSQESMTEWGWRVPLLLGCLIIPLLLRLRRSLPETTEFAAQRRHPGTREILRSLLSDWKVVLTGTLMVVTTTVSFYMITAYTPTFGSQVLSLSSRDSLLVTSCVGASNLLWLPLMGALSDRVGRKPLLLAASLAMLASAYPAVSWLAAAPSFSRLLLVQLWLSFLYATYNGAMVVFLAEMMPLAARTCGFALAYSLATATFGGFTPAISTYLVHATHNPAIPGVWLACAAACGLGASLAAGHRLPQGRAQAVYR